MSYQIVGSWYEYILAECIVMLMLLELVYLGDKRACEEGQIYHISSSLSASLCALFTQQGFNRDETGQVHNISIIIVKHICLALPC